jgi:uncharacterized repeat protein (TIGR01451 family)
MNQWYAKKKHVSVLLTLVGAILMGLVWLAGVPESVHAQGTFLLNTSYKDATPRNVGAGGTVAYSIVLKNDTTTTTTAIDVLDPLAAQLTYVGFSARVIPEGAGFGFPSGSGVRFTVDPIAAGDTVTLSFQATVATTVLPGDIITNTATITEGGLAFARSVTVTVEDYPSAQINEPWNNQLFTTRGTFTIKGRAWTGDEPGFPEPPVLSPIVNGGGANDWYVVQWTAVPNAVQYVLQESTDMYFSTITDEVIVDAPTTSRSFTSQPRGKTYYYRAKTRTLEHESRWSAVQSVTVNPTGLLFQPLNAVPVMPSVAPLAAVTAPTVEVNIKKVGVVQPDNWQQVTTITADPTGDWWNWTYAWPLPVEDDAQYDIQVRAKGIDGNFDPTKVDTVRVTIRNGVRYMYLPIVARRWPPLPYAPTLAVPSNDTYGNYQLSWSYTPATDPFKPTSYTFQEATNSSFTTPVELSFPATTLSHSYTNKAVGTYYYRVRGNNAYGAGPWSNVQTIVVRPRGFFDDFSNVNSGWPRQVFKARNDTDEWNSLDANYDNGYYRMKILLNTNALNNKRLGIIPAPYNNTATNYDVEVVHRFIKAADQILDPGWGHAGLVFAATKSSAGYFNTIYSVDWSFDGRCSVVKRTGIDSYTPISWLNMTNLLPSVGCPGYTGGYDRDVTFRAEVRGSQVTVFINNVNLGTFTDSGIGTMHQTGLATASWDYTPVQSRFDNFRVTVR